MGIAQNAGYYERTQERAAVIDTSCGLMVTCLGGLLSTGAISVLTSKIWSEALYFVPMITVTGVGVLIGSVKCAMKSDTLVGKVACGFFGGVGCVASAPFLIGAVPAGAAVMIECCLNTCNQVQETQNRATQNRETSTEI